MKRKILLIEPNYQNKFPPVGLMKISTYFKNRKDDVIFYKGDMNDFVIHQITEECIEKFISLDSKIAWRNRYIQIFNFIKYGRKQYLEQINLKDSQYVILLNYWMDYYRNQFSKKGYKQNPQFDFVGVTTLFTFYWKITVDTILFAKDLVKDKNNIMVGGVLASIQPKELSEATGIPMHKHGKLGGIHVGTLSPGDIDIKDKQPIDELELDYSILDEIDYKYDMSNAYYRYTTRGCVNKCAFCAVPTLEPNYIPYISLKDRIDNIRNKYCEQKDLLLMDNNVLASENYEEIIKEIIDCGFEKGAKFHTPNYLEFAIRNLRNGINDRAYIRKSCSLIKELLKKLTKDEEPLVNAIIEKYNISEHYWATKENLLKAYEEIKPFNDKHYSKGLGKLRFVDFNQGMDARLFTPEKAELLSKIAIRPVRIAFDDIKTEKKYREAIEMCVKVGIRDFSNYLLYNFKDKPIDLYRRLKINVDYCENLKTPSGQPISIYSFPMKYHPIRKTSEMEVDYSHNRDYIGENWNRKYIRAIQAILNSTKGKIGRGTSFFNQAFGENEEEFNYLLLMPETMIIYRFYFMWLNSERAHEVAMKIIGNDSICNYSVNAWRECFNDCKQNLSKDLWNEILQIIYANDFNSKFEKYTGEKEKKLLSFYTSFRVEIITPGSDMYKMRQEYEKNPTMKRRKHWHSKEEKNNQ